MGIKYVVNLPALPEKESDAAEIAGGQLTLKNGDQESVISTQKDQTVVEGLSGEQNSTVDLSFVWVDDAGNPSDTPLTASGVLLDTFAPVNPTGVLGITTVGEE